MSVVPRKSSRSSSTSSSTRAGSPAREASGPQKQRDTVAMSKRDVYRNFIVLVWARMAEPVAYVIPFVYVNQMIEHLEPNVPKDKIGTYSGAVESLFALVQFLTTYHWGKLSDHPSIGRKPVILIGLFFLAIFNLLMGVSKSFAWMLCTRVASGMLSGCSSAMRAVLGEISTKETDPYFYPLFATTFDIVIVLAPPIGGVLADPVAQYPGTWLASLPFLREFPYFLPSLFSSIVAISAFFVVLFGLDETLAAKTRKEAPKAAEDGAPTERSSLLPSTNEVDQVAPAPTNALAILRIPAILHVMIAFFIQVFLSLSFDSVFILFAYSEPKLGGIGLSSTGIAGAMVSRGIMSICFAIFAFGPLQKHVGASKLYACFVACWAVAYGMPPIMNALVLNSPEGTYVSLQGSIQWPLWPYIIVNMLCYALGDAQFPLASLALNNSVSDPSILGAVNGLCSAICALGRACGPFLVNLGYSLSIQHDFSIGIWIVMIALTGCAVAQTRLVSFSSKS